MTASASTFCRGLSRADCSRFFNAVRGSVALLLHHGSLINALRNCGSETPGWQEVQWRPRHGTEQSLPEIGAESGSWHGSNRRSSASLGQVEHLAAPGVVPGNPDPRELVDGFDGLAVACKRWGPRQAHHSRRPQAANREPSLRCCWNRSRCAIKSPCSSAAELVARAFAFGIDCFGFCSRVGGRNSTTV